MPGGVFRRVWFCDPGRCKFRSMGMQAMLRALRRMSLANGFRRYLSARSR